MDQLALGAFIPFVLIAVAYALRHGRAPFAMLLLTPVLMAMGAVWAIVPDVPRLLGWHDLYMRLASDPRCDIFFWHYTIDQIEQDSSWYAVAVAAMLAALLLAAWRELNRIERR